jgi:CHAT domain-containing protein
VRERLEELKSEELRDYFQDACLAPLQQTRAESVVGSMIVYPVVLPDRTELIVSRADRLDSVRVPVRAETLVAEVSAFRSLVQNRTTRQYRRPAAALYDLLIRPIEAELRAGRVETLVFVPDRTLRGVPLAALYDRESGEFLVEKVALALIPALDLTEPRAIDREDVRTLLAGLTVARQGFPPLDAVEPELEAVGDVFAHTRLVDEAFRAGEVESALAEEHFGIVHIATHAQFAGDASKSFLLTYDGRLGMDQLSHMVERTRYRDEPIELLTLSACETAAGDERASLGLAGIAIRSGARSALATLWTVNDQAAADLVGEFYRQLAEPGVSKAEALRRAQLALLAERSHRHPGYWSPFVLISNWM